MSELRFSFYFMLMQTLNGCKLNLPHRHTALQQMPGTCMLEPGGTERINQRMAEAAWTPINNGIGGTVSSSFVDALAVVPSTWGHGTNLFVLLLGEEPGDLRMKEQVGPRCMI